MSETARAWTEIIFNTVYLIIIWGLIIAMLRRRQFLPSKDRQIGNQFLLAFALLALGDVGHVGFRSIAFLQGQAIASAGAGERSLLVGLGTLATSITVSFFYILMAIIWRRRFKKPYGWFGVFLILCGFARLILLAFPQNQWDLLVPPQPWSVYRNLPLAILGVGVAFLFLRDAHQSHDRLFTTAGICILLSFAFYLPVILFVQTVPLLGMLMIPKTIAYLAVAYFVYLYLFRPKTTER